MKRAALALLSLGAAHATLPAAAAPPPRPTQAFDWCSDVVVRPDERFAGEGSDCTRVWRDEEIASGAGVVLIGSYNDVSDSHFAHPGNSACGWPTSHADNARYVAKLRALRGSRPPLRIVHMTRFDLVADSLAALPGFQSDFLLTTDRPWSDVLAFFANDPSPACGAEGCRWSDAFGAWEDRGKGTWLSDRIDAAGAPGRYRSAVYYLVRGAQVERHFWPLAALADLRNPAYRAWRVGEARRSLEQGGYDAVSLNHKFHQYFEPHWIGSAALPDAAAVRANGDDTFFSAPPRGYGLREFMQGYIALAADLKAAGVPYAIVDMPEWPWVLGADDPRVGNPAITRGLREAIRGARIVLLERHPRSDQAGFDAFVGELERAGVQISWIESSCGFSRR